MAFYYSWYGVDRHWKIRQRRGDMHGTVWKSNEGVPFNTSRSDIPASFYPYMFEKMNNEYDSMKEDVIELHMKWLRRANVGTIVLSWWGIASYEDQTVWKILNMALQYNIQVAFYIEPYQGGWVRPVDGMTVGTRTPQTAAADVKYIIDTYGCHKAFYRKNGRPLFFFFGARMYDWNSWEAKREWRSVNNELHENPRWNPWLIDFSVRLFDTVYSDWDGGHEYDCFSASRSSPNWKQIATEFEQAGKVFYYTVCPGYDKLRYGTNDHPVIDREDGAYYERFWNKTIEAKIPSVAGVLVNSLNEIHEGTQIEPCIPKSFEQYTQKDPTTGIEYTFASYTYDDYEGAWGLTGGPAATSYLDKTALFAEQWLKA